jgi:hypothetical protein
MRMGSMRTTLPVLALLSACALFGPRKRVELQLDRSVSIAPATVKFSIYNGLPQAITIPQCDSHILLDIDRHNGEQWVHDAATMCLGNVYFVSTSLEPGQSLSDSLLFQRAGEYRLRVGVYRPDGASDVVASESIYIFNRADAH